MSTTARTDLALLMIRVMCGVAMMFHGYSKIRNPLHWMDGAPNPPPAVLQGLAALAEFGGGLGIALGVLTSLSAFGIACTMAYAVWMHVQRGDPFVGRGGSFEPALLYLVLMLSLLLLGPGNYTVARLRPR